MLSYHILKASQKSILDSIGVLSQFRSTGLTSGFSPCVLPEISLLTIKLKLLALTQIINHLFIFPKVKLSSIFPSTFHYKQVLLSHCKQGSPGYTSHLPVFTLFPL